MLQIIRDFLASAMCAIQLFGFGMIIFNTKLTDRKKYNIVMFIIASIFITIVFSNFDGTIKTLLMCVVFTLSFHFIFNTTFIKSIFTSLIYVILNIIPDLIVLNSMIYIFGVTKDYCYENIAGGIISNTFVAITMIILTYIFRKPLRKLINYDVSASKKIVFISILILAALGIFFYNLISVFETNNNIIAYLVVIFTLISVLFYLFWYWRTKNKSSWDEKWTNDD